MIGTVDRANFHAIQALLNIAIWFYDPPVYGQKRTLKDAPQNGELNVPTISSYDLLQVSIFKTSEPVLEFGQLSCGDAITSARDLERNDRWMFSD